MKTHSLKYWVMKAFWGSAVRLPIGLLLVIYLLASIRHGSLLSSSRYFTVLEAYFTREHVWLYWALMWPLLFFVHAVYPYARERKPSYIKKMKAQEEKLMVKERSKKTQG